MNNKLLIFGLLTCFCLSTILLSAQPPADADEYEKKYQKRIKKDYLYGVYIPKDLADAFTQLNRLVDESSKRKFLAVPDTIAAQKLHFSLGRWMIHNWGFYGGSRFSAYLKSANIHHPDDMAAFVIVTYHRYLRKEPLKIKQLAERFVKHREAEKKKRMENSTILHQETRKRSKPEEGG